MNTIQQPIENDLNSVLNIIAGPLTYILMISIGAIAIGIMFGRRDIGDLASRMLTAGAVVTLVGAGSVYYESYVVGLFTSLPTYFSQQILGGTSNNPAAGFDVAAHLFFANSANLHWNLIWNTAETIASFGLYLVSLIVFFGALVVIFGAWLVSQILTQLLLMIGPVFVLAFLFEKTYGWGLAWVGELSHQAIVMLGLILLVNLILGLIHQAFSAMPNTNIPIQMMENLFGVALVTGLLSITVPLFWKAVAHIFAAAGAPSTNAARFLTNAAGAAAGGAGAVINNITRITNRIPGPSTPPIRSISRS